MKDSDIKLVEECEDLAKSMLSSEVIKWIDHLDYNKNNDSHLEVKEEILKKLKLISSSNFVYSTAGVGRKEVNEGLEPSWTDCCEGSCI